MWIVGSDDLEPYLGRKSFLLIPSDTLKSNGYSDNAMFFLFSIGINIYLNWIDHISLAQTYLGGEGAVNYGKQISSSSCYYFISKGTTKPLTRYTQRQVHQLFLWSKEATPPSSGMPTKKMMMMMMTILPLNSSCTVGCTGGTHRPHLRERPQWKPKTEPINKPTGPDQTH